MLKAPVFPFSWQFLASNLRSFSFLTESISASRNLPVPSQEKFSLTLAIFIWIRLSASFPTVEGCQGIYDKLSYMELYAWERLKKRLWEPFCCKVQYHFTVKMIIQNVVLVYHVCGMPYICMYSEDVLSLMQCI